ncbi:MAG: 30S ribosome-binding factor RbfA [Ignavibacteriaceae bacterium]|nr:30S ribosome-binding factor RbfA [Ignavibacteriaceae bacterium]
MSSYRIDKVEHLIKAEISLIFLYKLQDPAFELLTITGVKVSADLKIAKIYISVFDKEKRPIVLEKIETASGYIRSALANRIKLRYTPELKFFIDDTIDYVEKIEGLIQEIHKDDVNKRNDSEQTV